MCGPSKERVPYHSVVPQPNSVEGVRAAEWVGGAARMGPGEASCAG